MPLEGHWERVNTPVRQLTLREKRIAIGAATAVALTLLVLVLVTAGNTRPPPGPGCIRAMIPHVMGAEELNLCGGHARRACAQNTAGDTPVARSIGAACRKAGV